ncbi:similar to S100 calcium-binding protein, ventral prostate (predicted) [Rattus norvegicus]|uniref:S100 calcium binding protein A7 like 2 n=2 Tax=Rattus norvegicus TaxID=10116 RepID=D3Z9U8_RAT|nr:uncharacterized protein LOC499657 [Rattus norvegicus]EDL87902.1 similar to S100 calcium-binding protein, ventral prostate (predicted) [Rattus norvegicus]|eukprot:NP_001102657.1 uncharacterized protein LOC499657 [Rattus norvegicus]
MAQNLTSSEQEVMKLFDLFQNYHVRRTDKLDVQETKRVLREFFPNFMKALNASGIKILNDLEKEITLDEIWDMIGRMAMAYNKKNSNALKD